MSVEHAPLNPIVISAEQVQRLLKMEDCITAMESALIAVSSGRIKMPPRQYVPLVDDSGLLALMPGSCAEPLVYGLKAVSVHPANPQQGRPMIQGSILLFDHRTGQPKALIDGAAVTAIRTAAASGLATRLLARRDARTLGIFGYGVQAATHLEAMLAVRQIEQVTVWGRSADRARTFAIAQARRFDLDVTATDDPQIAAAADIVCTVTAAHEPVLEGAWLASGAHVNLVGAHTANSREADAAVIARGTVYVDCRAFALQEAGDIVMAIAAGAAEANTVAGEIGEILTGHAPARRDSEQITVFKSLGLVAEDLVAAELLYARAASMGDRNN